MPVRSVLRVNVGSLLALPMILLAMLYSLKYGPSTSDPYAVALSAAGTVTIAFVAPICAALGAWEGARFRRAGWWSLPHVRSRAVIAASSAAPVIVAGSIAVAAASELQLVRAGLFVPDVRLLALTIVVIAAHTLLGFAAGLWAPVVVAAPAALVVSFLWMAFPAAMDPLWLRHLNGSLSTCCMVQQDLALSAVAAAALVASGMIAAALVLIVQQAWHRGRAVISILPILVAFVAGSVIASPLGPDPAVARAAAALVCSTDPTGVEVCVWPEHARRLDEVRRVAVRAVTKWDAAGIPAPRRFSELEPANAADPAFGFSLRSTEADIISALAYSLLPPWPSCAETGPYPSAWARDQLYAWFAATAGMSEPELVLRFDVPAPPGEQSPIAVARALRSRPLADQRLWALSNLEAARGCQAAPLDVPAP